MSIVNSAIPTVKAITGWSPAAVGIWSILFAQLAYLGALAIKNGPSWIKAFSESRMQDANAKQELDASIETRLKTLEDGLRRSETVSMYLTGATTMLLTALRSVDPKNTAIPQANSLIEMAVAAGGDSAFAKGLAQLANVRGVGE